MRLTTLGQTVALDVELPSICSVMADSTCCFFLTSPVTVLTFIGWRVTCVVDLTTPTLLLATDENANCQVCGTSFESELRSLRRDNILVPTITGTLS